MFYLSNKKIKLFIISILLSIFCFILGIFDVKANEGNLEIFEPQDLQYAYKDNGNTYTEDLTLAPDDFDYVQVYDLFYASATDNYVENKSPRAYYSIRGIINNSNLLRYLAFIVYSPTQLELNKLEVCLYLQNSEVCTLNDGYSTHTSVTEVLLNGTSSSYFYLIKTNGFIINQSYSNPIIKYGLNWSGVSTLYATLPNSYLISGLLNFESETDRDNWLSSYSDYLENYAPEDPDIPANPILSPYIDTSSWGSDIGGWGSSFDSSTSTITDLVTMPITLLRAILNNLNSSCSTYTLGTLYNTSIVLPCISLSQYLGSGLVTTIDLLLAGLIIFKIGKRFVAIFDDFTNLRDKQISELYGGGK